MNPLTWLLTKLRRPVSLSAPTPPPVSLPALLTEAEREARQQQREQAVEQALAREFQQDMQQGRDLSSAVPLEVQRAVQLLRYNQADQEQAREAGQWAEQLRLVAEAQALEAAIQYQRWRHELRQTYGHLIGAKLSQHQVEVGMTLEMVLASRGTPTQVATSAHDPELYILRYGSVETGSLIELHRGVVTRALLGAVAFPEHVYDWLGVGGG